MERILLTCLTFSFNILKLNSLSTYVCPGEVNAAFDLNEYRNRLLCSSHGFQCTTDVNEIATTFKRNYELTVFIIHFNQLSLTRKINAELSKCLVNTVIVNVADTSYRSLPVCSTDVKTVVFTFTSLQLSFIESSYGNSDCLLQSTREEDIILNNIIESCPNTVWVIGDNTCNSTFTSTVHLRRFDTDFNTNLGSSKTLKIGLLGVISFINLSFYIHYILLLFAFHETPFVLYDRLPNGSTIFTGIVIEMITRIAANLQFKYEFIEPEDMSYGVFENNEWNGLIRMADKKEVDFVAAQLTITYQRSTAVDFSTPYFFEQTGILIRLPPPSQSLWKVTYVFSWKVWSAIGGITVAAMVYLYFLLNFLNVKHNVREKHALNCIWYIFSTLVNQDDLTEPTRKISFRIFTITWRLCVFMLISFYIGAFVGVLSIVSYPLSIENFQELKWALSNGTFQICIEKNTAFHDAVLYDSNWLEVKLWLSNHEDFLTTAVECEKKLLSEPNLALVSEVTYLKILQKSNCHLVDTILLDERFFPGYFAFAFPKHSSLNALISREMASIIESGLIDAWKMVYDKIVFCQIVEGNHLIQTVKMSKLKIPDISVSFILILVGCFIGLITFLIEHLINRTLRPFNMWAIIRKENHFQRSFTLNSTTTNLSPSTSSSF